jgi:hypothetical protein
MYAILHTKDVFTALVPVSTDAQHVLELQRNSSFPAYKNAELPGDKKDRVIDLDYPRQLGRGCFSFSGSRPSDCQLSQADDVYLQHFLRTKDIMQTNLNHYWAREVGRAK